MKLNGWLSLLLLLVCSWAQGDAVQIRQAALESARAVLSSENPDDSSDEGTSFAYSYPKQCKPRPTNLYAGQTLWVRILIRPSQNDFRRLRRHIEAARRADSNFIGKPRDAVRAAQLNYGGEFEVPIYDRRCGYLFHVRPQANPTDPLITTDLRNILNQAKAQNRLKVNSAPTLVAVYGTLTPYREGYMWVKGSKAITAFRPNILYRIVDLDGKPISPLKTELAPRIIRENYFFLGDEAYSANWYFEFPIRLEPLPTKP